MNYLCLLSLIMIAMIYFYLISTHFSYALPPGLSNFPYFSTGNFSNMQHDDSGNSLWNISGEWIGNLPSVDKVNSRYADTVFNANISIIMTNDTQKYHYSLADFFLIHFSSLNNTKIFNGTSILHANTKHIATPIEITLMEDEIQRVELEPDVVATIIR